MNYDLSTLMVKMVCLSQMKPIQPIRWRMLLLESLFHLQHEATMLVIRILTVVNLKVKQIRMMPHVMCLIKGQYHC